MQNTEAHLRVQSLAYLHDIQGWVVGEHLRQLKHDLEEYEAEKAGFRPDQPRLPRGDFRGGQWTSGGGGGGGFVAETPKPKLPRIEENPKQPALGELDILNDILRGAGLLPLKLPNVGVLNAVGGGGNNNPYPDDAIEPFYGFEKFLLFLLSAPRSVASTILRGIGNIVMDGSVNGTAETDTSWTLGNHKSSTTWQNQMESRGWTNEDITATIQNGKQYPAPNVVRGKIDPTATATRYEYNGKFVVRDNQTGNILQISGDKFIPKDLP